MTNFNVGTITFKVLVNSEYFSETLNEIQQRIITHPTTVDVSCVHVGFNRQLTEAVETGKYIEGDMFKEEYGTTVNSVGDFDFSVKVET